MSKSKRKRQILKRQRPVVNNTYSIDEDLNVSLNNLAIKRTGGAINFRGVGFQLLYSCFTLLNELDSSNPSKFIRLEGIEDLDIIEIDNNQYIQLKSSINKIDAGSFWKMGVLQNFLEAFKINPNCSLKLVYNFRLTKGNFNDLVIKKITDKTVTFWKQKFEDSPIDISDIDFDYFIRNIHFIKVSEHYLIEGCSKYLFEKFNINLGTENQYLKALFYSSFNCSKERTSITYLDLKRIFQSVTDSFSKSPTNPAVENNWIQKIDFNSNDNSSVRDDYYEGKAAKPIHIVQNLPVKRDEWHNQILKAIDKCSVIVIKSSSGQGKSTLVWQTSFDLKQKGYSVYELKYCNENSNIAGLFDFLKSRVQIGELPIIVIDGLNNILSRYYELIDITHNLPVKFLITTRQVDWYRYGLDLSKTSVKIIDISLSINEAEKIFLELKNRDKIHLEISNWQSVWEKIEPKGLLIEYVYLLTKGEMISNRLNTQIKELNSENDANSKIEILRLISIADVLNLKVKSIRLINHIQENIGFTTDRGETLKQLEKEFYLRFDEEFIEGLHPVRSQHLVDILNNFAPITETLLSLYKIITEDFIYDYFIAISPLVKSELKDTFYDDLAKLVSKQKFSEMVYAIDGLMHSEPLQYWTENKAVFDEVFNHGGIELFITETLPFTKLDTIKNLNGSLGKKFPGLNFFSQKSGELTPYDIKESDILKFTNYLSNHIDTYSNKIESYQGLGFLIKWFKQLSVSIPLNIELNENELLEILKKENIDEASELFSYYNISNPKKYLKFIKTNKKLIIGILKRQTNSLSVSFP
ncbi:P-loop NTPase [Salegentibacter sp. F14]